MGRISISVRRPFWFARRTARKCWSRDKNPAWSTRLIRTRKGKILWQTRVGKGGLNGGVQWGMASDEQKVYAAVYDTSGVMNTAGPVGGATFDPAKGGGLTALHLEDGSKAWFAPSHPCDPPRPGCSPGQSAALTLIPGVVFSAVARWARARVQHRGRRDALGFRYRRRRIPR